MNKRKKVRVPKTRVEKTLDYICWVLIIGILMYMLYELFRISGQIPTHYNLQGKVDSQGSKWVIFAPYGMMLLLYFVLTLAQKHPEWHNYPTSLRIKNTFLVYRTSKQLLGWIKLETVLLFTYLIWNSIQNSIGGVNGLGVWYLPALALMTVLTFVIYIIRYKRIE